MDEGFSLGDMKKKILPRDASDVYRNRLAYLIEIDFNSFKPAIHDSQIKKMFRMFSQKWELDIPGFDELIENADVFTVTSMLRVLIDLQKDLKVKNIRLGNVFFDPEKKNFKYFNFKPRAEKSADRQ